MAANQAMTRVLLLEQQLRKHRRGTSVTIDTTDYYHGQLDFRFLDEDVYEYEIFSILSTAHA